MPERRRENLHRVELGPGSFVLRIKRGDGPVHLSLDDGRVVTVGLEGELRIVRVQRNLEGWILAVRRRTGPRGMEFLQIPGRIGCPEGTAGEGR